MNGASPLASNGGDAPLTVWIEPRCDEFVLPSAASLGCVMLDAPADTPLPEVEVNADGMLVIWASASGRTLFTIDGIAQDTGSREIALPSELFAMPVKRFVGITFGSAWNSSRRIGFETAKSSPGGGGSF